MKGIIVRLISDTYTVKSQEKRYDCKARGLFRKDNISPLVGDMVIFDEEKRLITKILPRKNELIRPPLANADQVIILMSATLPTFSFNFLDKMLLLISFYNVKPLICLTKMDLLSLKERIKLRKELKYYQKIGYPIYSNKQIRKIKKTFKNKITVLAGQSGVGKSTFLNKIDQSLSLKTGEISSFLKRGKQTTRHVELFDLGNGLVADTPGFSLVSISSIPKEEIKNNMKEFIKYQDKCQYQDCYHLKEENCYIKHLVKKGLIKKSRYDNYLSFLKGE
ncbi:MAG: ribosome small subunit-dependent GTPase A [Bacilli bacterium]|jgi:ribosome biogenesis GTPase